MENLSFERLDEQNAFDRNARIGLMPVRCPVCGLPLGNCLQLVGTHAPGEELRQAFLTSGFGPERLCCRDAGLSRATTVEMLRAWIGFDRSRRDIIDSDLLRVWNDQYGPFAFLRRAEDEAVATLVGAKIDFCLRSSSTARGYDESVAVGAGEWKGPWIVIKPTGRSSDPPQFDKHGTRFINILGDIQMQTGPSEPVIEIHGETVFRMPSCGAVRGEALRIGSRLYAPLSSATFKRNRIVTTSTTWSSDALAGHADIVDVCFSSMDPRSYEGRIRDRRAPSVVAFRLRLKSKIDAKTDSLHVAANVPVVIVKDVQTSQKEDDAEEGGQRRSRCTLSAWIQALGELADIADYRTTFLELVTDEEDGDSPADVHQRALLVHRCFLDSAGDAPNDKTLRASMPHLNYIEDDKMWARHAFRVVAQMVRKGAKVFYRRATPDDPRSCHDYNDIGYSLSCEAVLALRVSAAFALRAVVRAKANSDPIEVLLQTLQTNGLYRVSAALSNKSHEITRKEITTFANRRHPVSREISTDSSFATMHGRNVSSHDESMESRVAKLRDDGFVDHRDTTDSNPGQRSYMTIGTVVSLRAPWDQLRTFADQVFISARLDPDDPLVPLGRGVKLLTVCGTSVGRYAEKRAVEIECLVYHALLLLADEIPRFAEVSLEPTSYGLDMNGLPGRLLRPVVMKDVRRIEETDTWQSLRRQGVVRMLSQDEQMGMQVVPHDDHSVKLPKYRTARELHRVLRNGYRVAQMDQIDNGHPSRASYSLKQLAAGAVNTELFPTLAGCGKIVGASVLCEGPFMPDILKSLPEQYVGVPMAVAFGCTGGLNQEDSIAVAARYIRGLWLAKDVAVHVPSASGKRDELLSAPLTCTSGQQLASFKRTAASSSKQKEALITNLVAPVDGRVVATFEEASRVVALVRRFLPVVEGHKIGFLWQKMTICIDSAPLTASGLEISGIMHPPSQLSRQSPGQIVTGMRRLMASGRCISCRLSGTHQELRDDISREDWTSSEFHAALVSTPDVSHTGESCVHDDNTGKFLGRRMILLQQASHTGKNSPLFAVSAHSLPGKNGIGLGPRQEAIMRMHHLSLGFNAGVEECAPDVVMSGGKSRLKAQKICQKCHMILCDCDEDKQTVMMPPKLATFVHLAGAAQLDVIMEPESTPYFATSSTTTTVRDRSRSRSRTRPASRAQLFRASFGSSASQDEDASASQQRCSVNVVQEDGERVLYLTGLGATLVGHAFVAALIEDNQIALTRVWDSSSAVAPGRGSLCKSEIFAVRILSDDDSMHKAIQVWRQLWEQVAGVEAELIRCQHVAEEDAEPQRFTFEHKRWAVNLVRVYARDALAVPRFYLDEKQPTFHRDALTGRIILGAQRKPTSPDASPAEVLMDSWARSHYEWSALSDSLVAVPLMSDIPNGAVTLTLEGDSPLVSAKDLRLDGGVRACSKMLNLDLFPRLRAPRHEAPKQKFKGHIKRIPPIASDGRTGSIIGGAAASALPYAKINEVWNWSCVEGLEVLLRHPREAERLFGDTVCPKGLFSGNAPSSQAEAEEMSRAVSAKCDGCGACVDAADHMIFVDIEDIPKSDCIARAERAAAGRPIRGSIKLTPLPNRTVINAATGNGGAETANHALQRAASEARLAWEHAL